MDLSSADFPILAALGLIGLGVLVGAYGTLIGAGGGFLLVPMLLLVDPGQVPATVTAISLTVVFFNAYAGTWAYARMGRIDFAAGLLFAVAGIPGAVLGTWVVGFIPRDPFDLTFGVLLLALGLWLVIHPVAKKVGTGHAPGKVEAMRQKQQLLIGSVGSAYLGLLASVLGIGGGILHVPFLIRVLGYPAHIATATSQFVLALVALTASLSHLFWGELNRMMVPTAFLALGVMLGAPIGAALSTRLRGPRLVRLLAVALCVVAARILWRLAHAG
jgi:uncharacterized membrane protein YfcA